MEREQLKKEIRELAEKIKAGDAADAEALLSDVAQRHVARKCPPVWHNKPAHSLLT